MDREKKNPCKAWPCYISNVVSGLYFSKETSNRMKSAKAHGWPCCTVWGSLCHILLSLRIHYTESTTLPQAVSIFSAILRSVTGTKAQGNCSMDLAIDVKATSVPVCHFVCLFDYLEMQLFICMLIVFGGHLHTYFNPQIYLLLFVFSAIRALASKDIS